MKSYFYTTTIACALVLGLAHVIGSPMAKAQVQLDAIRNCLAKSNDKEKLACFDELGKANSSPDVSEDTANTSKVLQPTEPTEYRVVDATDVYVAPNKYTDKPIELRRMKCLHADKDEYRCIAPGGNALVVFAAGVEPATEKDAIETKCGEIKKILSRQCEKTIRLTPATNSEDIVSGYCKRTIIITQSIEVVPTKGRKGKRDVVENYPPDWKVALGKGK